MNAAGIVERFIAVLHDGSARADAERLQQQAMDDARAAQQMAETANRMKDEFLATISHELRTPIGAVLGWIRILRDEQLDAGTRQRGIDAVERSAKATATIIEDLLDVSRVVTGELRIGRSVIDLDELVRIAVEAVGPAALTKYQNLSVSITDQACHCVMGDGMRLQQVVWNLLSNAIRYTPNGGRINVAVYARGHQAHIRISDTGQGIRAEVLPFIFQRFRQGDGSTTRRHGGLGLGLAIASHLIHLHGGTITAQSDGAGQGATFLITMPLEGAIKVPEQLTLAADAPLAVLDGSDLTVEGVRVLIVEPETDTREFVTATLQQHGASVTGTTTVAETRRMSREERFDVLLCATELPDEDAFGLLQSLRTESDSLVRHAPALALTRHLRGEDRPLALAAGFQMQLRKPIDPGELIAAVGAVRRQTTP
jgi:CheY-like chemotaxis protein/nitrogen-specific signal transduction histidine kinase